MNLDTGFNFDPIGMLRRRAGLIAVIAGGILLAAYWISMALANQYTSSATIFVQPQAVAQSLVEASVGQEDLTRRINLMTAQILSRPRLSRLIDDLDLYPEESKTMLREEVIELMREHIRVEPVLPEMQSRSRREQPVNTFQVFYTARSPVVAAEVAQRLANDFIKEHIEDRVEMTQKSLEFLQAEEARLVERGREVDAEISRIKSENAQRLPEDMHANQRVLERHLVALQAARRELSLARSDVAFWESQVLNVAALDNPRDDASPSRRLQMLKLARAEMESRGFTEKHPDIIKNKAEMEALEEQIAAAAGESESEEVALNAAQQTAEGQRRRAELQVAASEAEIEKLEETILQVEARLAQTPAVAEQLESLEREHQSLSRSLGEFDRRRQEAAVHVNLERRQLGEQFRVLEPAFPPVGPSSPNRILILAIGLVAGVGLGVMAAVLLETSDSSFHDASGLQGSVDLPVLASIPEILLESDLADRRRKFVRQLVVSTAVVVFCLVGGFGTYLVVNGVPGWLSFGGGDAPAEVAAQAGTES